MLRFGVQFLPSKVTFSSAHDHRCDCPCAPSYLGHCVKLRLSLRETDVLGWQFLNLDQDLLDGLHFSQRYRQLLVMVPQLGGDPLGYQVFDHLDVICGASQMEQCVVVRVFHL